jgi:hypothetical protein
MKRLGRFARFNLLQTIVVAELAGPRKTRTAIQSMPNHSRARPERSRPQGIRRAEDRDGRDADGGREMHASGIVANERIGK